MTVNSSSARQNSGHEASGRRMISPKGVERAPMFGGTTIMQRTDERPRFRPGWPGRVGLVLIALAALGLQLAASPAPGQAPASDVAAAAVNEEAGLELIVATYNVLQDRFFRPLDSRELLGAAWLGALRGLESQRLSARGIASPPLTGDREGDLAAFSTQYRELLAAAGSGVDGATVALLASANMAASVDEQHTAVLSPAQFAQFRASLTSESGSVGLGVVINGQRAPFTIGTVIVGSPAAQAGVQEGDQIERVDGRDTSQFDLRQLSDALRGEAGQPVTLGLRRGGEAVEIVVVRGRYVIPPLTMRVLPEGVCHLQLSRFPVAFVLGPSGRTISEDLDAALEQCEQAGAQGWIFDMRGNGGGGALSQVLGRFLDHGPILVERDKIGGRYEQAADGHLFRVQRPLVVLIDGGSASASEAFASAIQEYKRGVVIGERSAGALNTANVLPLPLGAGISVAIREVFTGRQEIVVDEVGVTPDIVVRSEPGSQALPPEAIELSLRPPAGVGPLPAPAPEPEGAVLSQAELRRLIEPVQLRAEDAERPEDAVVRGDLAIDTLNYYSSDTPSLQAGEERALRLGWRGGYVRWLGQGFPPPYALDVELYRDADGAHRDFREIYEPGEPRNPPQWVDVDSPIALGDDIRAVVGTGQNEGRIWIMWRRNNVVYIVARNVPPGEPKTFDALIRLAQIVDGRAAQVGP
jgi:carboxyl-terminal processing protease